jgi:2-polyprenyl-3-methyl-5-hydroxy-6-metoxy-1,4-benzoquinol methylase
MTQFAYIGSELDLFSHATHWKAYWSQRLRSTVGEQVLDVGAGIGSTIRTLHTPKQKRWVALEPDSNLTARLTQDIENGSLPASVEVVTGTLDSLPAGRAFDTILYIDVLEHIEDDRAELIKAERFLSEGGAIVVLSPAHNFFFTPFDTAIGHFRRYDRKSLRAAIPPSLHAESIVYLDSVGMLASLGNKLLLKSAHPTTAQIALWDSWMVPVSRLIDPLTGFNLGKTIVAVLRRA